MKLLRTGASTLRSPLRHDGPARNGLITRRETLMRGLAGAGGLMVAGLAGSGPSAAADVVSMRVGSDSPINAPHTASAVKLKEEIERQTGGRIKVTIFPDSQLGSNEAMSNSVKAGTLDAVVTDVAVMSVSVPQGDVFSLPFLFSDTQHVLRAANGEIGAKLKPLFEKAFHCEVLGWATDGARNMWNGKRPIRTPDDLKGLKMRVQPSKIQRDTYEAFGAIPTPIAFSEVYTALQTGVVDGADHAPVDMVELKLYQVTKYLTLTRHFSIVSVLIVGDKFMGKLAEADKAIVRTAGKLAADTQATAVLAAEQEAINTLKTKGVQVFDMSDPKAFVDMVQPVYKNNEARIGADLIQLARSTA